MNSFTIHIVSSNYSGPAGSFNLEKKFFRKYENVKGLSKRQLLRVGKFIQDDIKSFVRKHGWKNIEKAILLNEVSPDEVMICVEDSQQDKAKWLNFGTDRHWLSPKTASVLHWEVPGVNQWGAKFVGGDAFSKGHWHPGTIAYDFFKLSKDARSKVQNYINKLKIFSKN